MEESSVDRVPSSNPCRGVSISNQPGACFDCLFKQSETNRIVRFYNECFDSSADNVVNAYSTMADGLDALGLTNIGVSESILKKAAGADKLPAEREAEVSARAFAAFIAQPRR